MYRSSLQSNARQASRTRVRRSRSSPAGQRPLSTKSHAFASNAFASRSFGNASPTSLQRPHQRARASLRFRLSCGVAPVRPSRIYCDNLRIQDRRKTANAQSLVQSASEHFGMLFQSGNSCLVFRVHHLVLRFVVRKSADGILRRLRGSSAERSANWLLLRRRLGRFGIIALRHRQPPRACLKASLREALTPEPPLPSSTKAGGFDRGETRAVCRRSLLALLVPMPRFRQASL